MQSIVRTLIDSRVHSHTSNDPDYRNSADGTFPKAKTLVPESLDLCSVTTMRRFFQKTWRYMDSYQYVLYARVCDRLDNATSRKGLDARQAAYANKKYKSHRRVGLPSDIIAAINAKNASGPF